MANEEEKKKIEAAVFETFEQVLGVPKNEFTRESVIADTFSMDSLDKVEIIMFLEDELKVQIEDEEVSDEKVKTVNDLILVMESKF